MKKLSNKQLHKVHQLKFYTKLKKKIIKYHLLSPSFKSMHAISLESINFRSLLKALFSNIQKNAVKFQDALILKLLKMQIKYFGNLFK